VRKLSKRLIPVETEAAAAVTIFLLTPHEGTLAGDPAGRMLRCLDLFLCGTVARFPLQERSLAVGPGIEQSAPPFCE
jgi:hypothetical protein